MFKKMVMVMAFVCAVFASFATSDCSAATRDELTESVIKVEAQATPLKQMIVFTQEDLDTVQAILVERNHKVVQILKVVINNAKTCNVPNDGFMYRIRFV